MAGFRYIVLHTAAIISLLTHICIPVAFPDAFMCIPDWRSNISHHTSRDRKPNFATPAVQSPANPNQIQIFSQARYKLLAKYLGTWG